MTPRRKDPENSVLQSPYWRIDDAREVLDLCRRSGMSLSAFARSQGLSVSRLSRWRRILDEPAEDLLPRFHRVRVVESSAARGHAAEGIEILLADGRRVAVRSGFDGDLLAEVIRFLEALPC
jgi:transcriptional regulator with XRE-family HTH domain